MPFHHHGRLITPSDEFIERHEGTRIRPGLIVWHQAMRILGSGSTESVEELLGGWVAVLPQMPGIGNKRGKLSDVLVREVLVVHASTHGSGIGSRGRQSDRQGITTLLMNADANLCPRTHCRGMIMIMS